MYLFYVCLDEEIVGNGNSLTKNGQLKHTPSVSDKWRDKEWLKLVNIGIILYMFVNFVSRCVLGLIETLGAPMYLKMHNLPAHDTIDVC